MWMEARELDESELRQRIQAGIEAADELKERLARLDEDQSSERPKLRLIKGGAVAVALFAGVEWLRGYRRAAVGVLVTTAAAGSLAYVVPSIPDPPQAEVEPPVSRLAPSPKKPTPIVSVAPRRTPRSASPTLADVSPPRTSPLRTQSTTPVPSATPTKPPATATVSPVTTPVASITQSLSPSGTVLPSVTVQPSCPLLGLDPIRVCLDLSGNP